MQPSSIAADMPVAALVGRLGAESAIAQDGVEIKGEAVLRERFANQTFYGNTREANAWAE